MGYVHITLPRALVQDHGRGGAICLKTPFEMALSAGLATLVATGTLGQVPGHGVPNYTVTYQMNRSALGCRALFG